MSDKTALNPLMRESFWQNNSLVTYIFFELQPIITLIPVANFDDQKHDQKNNSLRELPILY